MDISRTEYRQEGEKMKLKAFIAAAILASYAGILGAQEFSFDGNNGLGSWRETKRIETKAGEDGLTLIHKGVDAKIYKQIRLEPGDYQLTVEGNALTVLVMKNWTKDGIIAKVKAPSGEKMVSSTGEFSVEKKQNIIFAIHPDPRAGVSSKVKFLKVEKQK